MSTVSSVLARLASSFIFWAAWIIIPLIMEIVPAIGSVALLVRRRVREARRPADPIIFPDVTVIVPVYNSADTLEACVDSIANGTYPADKINVFLVNNASSDDSFAAFSRCQAAHPELAMQWLDAAQGKSNALNLALYNSQGKYIVHVDSDGVLEREALANLVRRFEADPSVNVATGAIMVEPDLVEAYKSGPSRLLRRLEFMEYAQAFLAGRNYASEVDRVYTLSGAFTAFRSSAILTSWLYNADTICEDTQITFQMRYNQRQRLHVCEDAIFFVDPIEGVDKLYTQRQRWQRGSLEVAHQFGGERLSLRHALTDVNVSTLLYDHTFAFPRMIWYVALICLLAVGYSGTVVLGAMAAIYVLYVVCGFLYLLAVASFLRRLPRLRRYALGLWWVVPLLPAFNFVVFFIRLAGVINSIGTSGAWKTRTLSEERGAFASVVRSDFSRATGVVARLRDLVNYPEEEPTRDQD